MTPLLPLIKNDVSDNLSAGINIFYDCVLNDVSRLTDSIRLRIEDIHAAHLKELPPGFAHSRKLYRAFSMDPTKHRPSSEALWRRVKKGLEFPRVNPFVDLTNLLSLEYQVPYGLYDLDKVTGTVELRRGEVHHSYQGIRKDTVHLKGKPMLVDETGPFGNPSSDSQRTSTTEQTNQILQVIFFLRDDPSKEMITAESHSRFLDFFTVSQSKSYLI